MSVTSYSDNPVNIKPSKKKVKALSPELGSWSPKYIWRRFAYNLAFSRPLWKDFAEAFRLGDANPALVVSVKPLLVAAYAFELDCAVLLRFPDEFVERYRLRPKMQLLASNTYVSDEPGRDILPGARSSGAWTDFLPKICEFCSDDAQAMARRRNAFTAEQWSRVWECAVEYAKRFPHVARDGNPASINFVQY